MSEDYESGGWSTMESDPSVFSELLRSLGVPLIVDDLYALDASLLASLQPIYALIFLFKWVSNTNEKGGGEGTYDDNFTGFFANQVVNNACATVAVLNGVCNIPSLTMGTELSQFKSFTTGLDPRTCGEALTSSDFFRTAHNSLSPPQAVSLDGLNLPKTSEDAYHFVVYLPHAGSIFELDGLKPSPVRHGPYSESGEGWVAKAREVIESRIATYPAGSLHFNLLALRQDPLPRLQSQLDELSTPGSEGSSEALLISEQIHNENEKRAQWAFENSLRKHNHIGLIHAVLLALAKTGGLEPAAVKAREKMKERIEKRGMEED